jgi:hypothetical protein
MSKLVACSDEEYGTDMLHELSNWCRSDTHAGFWPFCHLMHSRLKTMGDSHRSLQVSLSVRQNIDLEAP